MYYAGLSLAHYQHLSSLKLPLHQGVNFLCPVSQEVSAQITSALALPNNLLAVNLVDPACWSYQLISKLNELAQHHACDEALLLALSNLGPSITLWLCPEQECLPKTIVIHLDLSPEQLLEIPPALFQEEAGQITMESPTKSVSLSQAAQRRLDRLRLKTKVSLGESAWFDQSTSKILQGYLFCLAHSSWGSYPKLDSQVSQFSHQQALAILKEYLTVREVKKIQDLLLALPDLHYETYYELAGQLCNVQELIYSDQIATIRDYSFDTWLILRPRGLKRELASQVEHFTPAAWAWHLVSNKVKTNSDFEIIALNSKQVAKKYHILLSALFFNNPAMLDARIWLLVEGHSDTIIYESWAKSLGINLSELGITLESFVEKGLTNYLALADLLGIDCLVLVDKDQGGSNYFAALNNQSNKALSYKKFALLNRYMIANQEQDWLAMVPQFSELHEFFCSPQPYIEHHQALMHYNFLTLPAQNLEFFLMGQGCALGFLKTNYQEQISTNYQASSQEALTKLKTSLQLLQRDYEADKTKLLGYMRQLWERHYLQESLALLVPIGGEYSPEQIQLEINKRREQHGTFSLYLGKEINSSNEQSATIVHQTIASLYQLLEINKIPDLICLKAAYITAFSLRHQDVQDPEYQELWANYIASQPHTLAMPVFEDPHRIIAHLSAKSLGQVLTVLFFVRAHAPSKVATNLLLHSAFLLISLNRQSAQELLDHNIEFEATIDLDPSFNARDSLSTLLKAVLYLPHRACSANSNLVFSLDSNMLIPCLELTIPKHYQSANIIATAYYYQSEEGRVASQAIKRAYLTALLQQDPNNYSYYQQLLAEESFDIPWSQQHLVMLFALSVPELYETISLLENLSKDSLEHDGAELHKMVRLLLSANPTKAPEIIASLHLDNYDLLSESFSYQDFVAFSYHTLTTKTHNSEPLIEQSSSVLIPETVSEASFNQGAVLAQVVKLYKYDNRRSLLEHIKACLPRGLILEQRYQPKLSVLFMEPSPAFKNALQDAQGDCNSDSVIAWYYHYAQAQGDNSIDIFKLLLLRIWYLKRSWAGYKDQEKELLSCVDSSCLQQMHMPYLTGGFKLLQSLNKAQLVMALVLLEWGKKHLIDNEELKQYLGFFKDTRKKLSLAQQRLIYFNYHIKPKDVVAYFDSKVRIDCNVWANMKNCHSSKGQSNQLNFDQAVCSSLVALAEDDSKGTDDDVCLKLPVCKSLINRAITQFVSGLYFNDVQLFCSPEKLLAIKGAFAFADMIERKQSKKLSLNEINNITIPVIEENEYGDLLSAAFAFALARSYLAHELVAARRAYVANIIHTHSSYMLIQLLKKHQESCNKLSTQQLEQLPVLTSPAIHQQALNYLSQALQQVKQR